MSVEEQAREIILEILDVKPEDIIPTASFIEDLNATSIDLVEILTAYENRFAIEIDDQQAAKLKTVQDAIDFLKAATGEQ